jgi:hypothetical protein
MRMGSSPDKLIGPLGDRASPAPPPAPPMLWPVPDEFLEITSPKLTGIDRALGYFGNEPYVLFAYEERAGEVMWKDGQSCGISHGACDVLAARVEPLARQRDATLGSDGRAGSHVMLVDRRRGRVYLAEPLMAEVFLCALYGFSRTRCIDPGRWAQRQRRRGPEN